MAIKLPGMPVCEPVIQVRGGMQLKVQAFGAHMGNFICRCDKYFAYGDTREEAFAGWKEAAQMGSSTPPVARGPNGERRRW